MLIYLFIILLICFLVFIYLVTKISPYLPLPLFIFLFTCIAYYFISLCIYLVTRLSLYFSLYLFSSLIVFVHLFIFYLCIYLIVTGPGIDFRWCHWGFFPWFHQQNRVPWCRLSP